MASRNKPPWAEMDNKKGLLNGEFNFKAFADGSLDKTKVICMYCRCELTYQRSMSSLKYPLLAEHTAEAENSPHCQRQATLDKMSWSHMCPSVVARWAWVCHIMLSASFLSIQYFWCYSGEYSRQYLSLFCVVVIINNCIKQAYFSIPMLIRASKTWKISLLKYI